MVIYDVNATSHVMTSSAYKVHTGNLHPYAYPLRQLLQPPSLPHFKSLVSRRHRAPSNSDVLAEPADTLAITLSHNHTAHENLNGSDTLERHLALARCLVET